MTTENLFKEASRRKDEFPSLSHAGLMQYLALERKRAGQDPAGTGVDTADIRALTCPACGHEVFYEDANIIHAKDYSQVDLWACGKCGHTNSFPDENN